MKIRISYLYALAVGLFVIIYFTIGTLKAPKKIKQTEPSSKTDSTFQVVVIDSISKSQPLTIQLKGLTEAFRTVEIRAETAALVTKTPTTEGSHVKKGTILCQLDLKARQELLKKAQANVKAKEINYEAKKALAIKGYISTNEERAAKALYEEAIASKRISEIELSNITIRAPFSGIFIKRHAEIGDFLNVGDSCGTLLQVNPMITYLEVTEKMLTYFKTGQEISVLFSSGKRIKGKVINIEARASSSTGLFRVELTSSNPNASIKSGIPVTVIVRVDTRNLHIIPASALILDAQNHMGIRYVDKRSHVRFMPIEIIYQDKKGIWVSGLPERLPLIVQGQGFVKEGQTVKAISSKALIRKTENKESL